MNLENAKVLPIEDYHITEIISWRYAEPYAIYNLDDDQSTKNSFKHNYYVVVLETGELFGYFCYGYEATIPYGDIYHAYDDNSYNDIGLGMNPKYVSSGLGLQFLSICAESIIKITGNNKLRLSVLDSNIRGRKLYHNFGFRVQCVFPANIQPLNFIVMTKE